MKKTVSKVLTALFIVAFLFGMVLASCGPIFDVGGDVNGNNGGNSGGTPQPPADGYRHVKAYDWEDLADYLQSDEISYAITLEMETTDIYLRKNLSIVKPMRIIGSPGNMYTIHSSNSPNGTTNYCLDLQADLTLMYCGFTGYGVTSAAGAGVQAGSPPINIRPGMTFTMSGNDSVLNLRSVGSGITPPRAGSQVRFGDSASITGESGDLLFKAGVEKISVNGKVSLKGNMTVGNGAILQIENGGELRVGPEATLKLDEGLKELRLDGNIFIDRTISPGGSLIADGLNDGSLLEGITGANGSLIIENGVVGENEPFEFGANTIVKLSSSGISLEKRVSSEIGGLVYTTGNLKIPKGKKLVVGAGVEFNVTHELTLEGGILDVAGNVKVTTATGKTGKIIITKEDKLNAKPAGAIVISGNGLITIDDRCELIDGYNGERDKSALWELEINSQSSLAIKRGPTFTLSGNATATLHGPDASLTGVFTVASGATLKVKGNGILTVRAPNQLVGVSSSSEIKITESGQVDIYSNSATAIPLTLSGGTYSWKTSGWH